MKTDFRCTLYTFSPFFTRWALAKTKFHDLRGLSDLPCNALEHNPVAETESTSLVRGNSLGNEVFFSYLQFLASFTTYFFFNFCNKSVRYPIGNIISHKVTELPWEFVGILFLLRPPSLIFVVSSPILLLVVSLLHSLLPPQSSPDLTTSYSPTLHSSFTA